MADRPDREGLSLWYRIGYRIQYALLSVFGPADLDDQHSPQRQLERRRAAKVAAAREARLRRETGER